MIRHAEPKDASRLAEILLSSRRISCRRIIHNDLLLFQQMQVLDLALHFRDNPTALRNLYVYDDNGVVKGIADWQVMKNKSIQIQELCADPSFYGEEIEDALLEDCLSFAADIGVKYVFAWVLEGNSHDRRFYERFHFRLDSQRKLQPVTKAVLCRYSLPL